MDAEISASCEDVVQYFKDEFKSRGERRNVPHMPLLPNISNAESENTPRCVSIGPTHWKNPKLQRMEEHKWWLVEVFQNDTDQLFEDIEGCFDGLRDFEAQARDFYSENISMESREFLVMLFLDALFITVRLLADLEKNDPQTVTFQSELVPKSSVLVGGRNLLPESRTANQRRRRRRSHTLFNFNEMTMHDVDTDLVMFNNQIPFCVLEFFSEWMRRNVENFSSLADHLKAYFKISPWLASDWYVSGETCHHLLHYLHSSILQEDRQMILNSDDSTISVPSGRKNWIPSATELQEESGIEFRLNKSPRSFLDIRFENGTVEIPKILVTKAQRLVLLNLIDFEQSNVDIQTNFSNFATFMCCLLSTEKDVRDITTKGVIERRLMSDKEVREFFLVLEQRCLHLNDGAFFGDLFLQINSYHESRRMRWKAIFLRKYCSNPWVSLTLMGAVVLFILTFLQTYFAMYTFYNPPPPQ